jgi:outer membrane immunogenic protein
LVTAFAQTVGYIAFDTGRDSRFIFCDTLVGETMRKFAIAAAALAVTSTAYAADMPLLKAPPMPVATAYDWSGFTGDVDVGGGWSNFNWAFTHPGPATLQPFSSSTSGLVYGGHGGFQKQWGWIVLGFEGGGMENATRNYASTFGGSATGPCTANVGQACQVHISDAIYTFGGKAGVAWGDWLFYGEGGGAWSQIQTQFNTNGNLFDPVSQNRHGYYAGGGFDYVLAKGPMFDLIAGVEYEHVDLGSRFVQSVFDFPNPNGPNSRTVSAKEDMVMAKLTVKWNPWTQPHP